MRKIYAAVLIFLNLTVYSQQFTVQGTILDKNLKSPLAFATVTLLQAETNANAGSALTDERGAFQIKADKGSYKLQVNYVGFELVNIQNPLLSNLNQNVSLEPIFMEENSLLLEEVEVRAEKSRMEFELDKRVFNVGKDLANSGSTAADILDRIPSVNVDPEGNLTLRGSGGVQILIDGKPSGMLASGETEALLRMQGNMIDKIEVITNPSARYEAEGEAGIINIILKKNQQKGFNGSFGLNTGYPENHGASYNLNYRKKDLNFFSNFGLDYRRFPGFGQINQTFFEGPLITQSYTVDSKSNRGGLEGFFQFGTDWNINDYNTLTASLLYSGGEGRNTSQVIYTDVVGTNTLQTIRDVTETEPETNIEASIDWRKTFAQPKKILKASFKYILDDELELADYTQYEVKTPLETILQKSSNTEYEKNILFQTDYEQPILSKGKFEAGARAALRTIDNDFTVQEEVNGLLEVVGNFDDRLAFQENIYALYSIGAFEHNKWGFQAGLRGELSDISARLLESGVSNDQNYFSLFPSGSMSYSFNEVKELQFSYSRRISRPFFRRLLPFSNFNDPRNNSIGNPTLRPEFTNALELGYLRYFSTGSFLTSMYYRHTTGVIETLTLPSENGTTIRFPVNLSERNAYGLELNYSASVNKWLEITSDLNFFRALVNGSYEETILTSDTFSWNGRVSGKADIGTKGKFQITYDYDSPIVTTQGKTLSIMSLDFAGSLDVLQNRGTITFSCRDLLNTNLRRSIIDLPELQAESVFQWRQARALVLSFNYRLNQDKKKGDLLGGRD